jgi:CheY-like chemotaxis protein
MAKVLVVDDDAVARRLIGANLERSGFAVITSSTAELGLRILEENPNFDLIITDYSMPDMSGRDLVEFIRTKDELSPIPVIMVSGIIKLSEINDLLQHGVDRFLPKPIVTGELVGYVAQLLKGKVEINRISS